MATDVPAEARLSLVPDDVEGRPADMEVAYRGSTHFRFWIFTPEQLRSIKASTHQKAMLRFPHLVEITSPGGSPPAPSTEAGAGAGMAAAARPGVPPSPAAPRTGGAAAATPGAGATPASPPHPHQRDMELVTSPSPRQKRKMVDEDTEMGVPTPAKKPRKRVQFQPLSVEEEGTLKRYWEMEIRRVCDELRFSHYIMATATLYLKRFYLYKTVLDVKPQDIMIPAIFLAIKAEASPFLEVETLVKQLKALLDLKDEQLVENEMLLLMGNRFHITVYHPFRPLRGLVRKFKDHVTRKVGSERGETESARIYERALELVHQSLTTDCPLLYHPGQIALAAMLLAGSPDVVVPRPTGSPDLAPLDLASIGVDIKAFVDGIVSEDSSTDMQSYNREAVEQAGELIKEALKAVTLNAEAKKLEARRRKCCNPAFIKGTAEYNARLAKKEQAKLDRKAAKRRAKQEALVATG